jgi:hypothetical protein
MLSGAATRPPVLHSLVSMYQHTHLVDHALILDDREQPARRERAARCLRSGCVDRPEATANRRRCEPVRSLWQAPSLLSAIDKTTGLPRLSRCVPIIKQVAVAAARHRRCAPPAASPPLLA